MSAQGALRMLRWTYTVFIAVSSAVTIVEAGHGHQKGMHAHHAAFVLVLAGVELAAAIALVFEPIEIPSAALLLVVFAVAFAASAASLDLLAMLHFGFYAVTLFYIVFAHRQLRMREAA